jgi:L-lactate dehydrogenase complex protein LldG
VSLSREIILAKLRVAQQPFTDVPPIDSYLPVVPLDDVSPQALRARFIQEATALACRVHQPAGENEAIDIILRLIGRKDKAVQAWNFDRIPLPKLEKALFREGITVTSPDDATVRVGISGADAALAATGSLVISSAPSQPRLTSLLPPLHIAVLPADRIVPDLESWLAEQRKTGLEHFRRAAQIVLISGPSRTGDIEMELVMGVHGPGELDIILV